MRRRYGGSRQEEVCDDREPKTIPEIRKVSGKRLFKGGASKGDGHHEKNWTRWRVVGRVINWGAAIRGKEARSVGEGRPTVKREI